MFRIRLIKLLIRYNKRKQNILLYICECFKEYFDIEKLRMLAKITEVESQLLDDLKSETEYRNRKNKGR